jgi:hypothetical protein
MPVDPERLRAQFPALTDDDLDAYTLVTRRILEADAHRRGAITREVLDKGRAAVQRAERREPLDEDDHLAARYLKAMEKMQGRTS